MESGLPDYQAVIDDALQLVYSQHHRLIGQLHAESFRELTLSELRGGPLGRDLQRLAALAKGEVREPKDLVLSAIDSVLQILSGRRQRMTIQSLVRSGIPS